MKQTCNYMKQKHLIMQIIMPFQYVIKSLHMITFCWFTLLWLFLSYVTLIGFHKYTIFDMHLILRIICPFPYVLYQFYQHVASSLHCQYQLFIFCQTLYTMCLNAEFSSVPIGLCYSVFAFMFKIYIYRHGVPCCHMIHPLMCSWRYPQSMLNSLKNTRTSFHLTEHTCPVT